MTRSGHSGWHKSARKSQLPRNWPVIRRAVARRAGGVCERLRPDGTRCDHPGSECHHVGDTADHSLGNLAWLCHDCHMVETLAQSAAAAQAVRDKLSHPSSRSTRKPPGLL